MTREQEAEIIEAYAYWESQGSMAHMSGAERVLEILGYELRARKVGDQWTWTVEERA